MCVSTGQCVKSKSECSAARMPADTNGSEFAATIPGPTAANDCVTTPRRVRSRSLMVMKYELNPPALAGT